MRRPCERMGDGIQFKVAAAAAKRKEAREAEEW